MERRREGGKSNKRKRRDEKPISDIYVQFFLSGLTFEGFTNIMTCEVLEGGCIGLYGISSVLVGGCSLTLIT